MRTCLYVHICWFENGLRRLLLNKNHASLILARELPTRLGTAHTIALAICFLASSASATSAQEDVAETKANTTIDATPINEPPITDQDRVHWSFQPIRRPALPPKSQIPNPKSEHRSTPLF